MALFIEVMLEKHTNTICAFNIEHIIRFIPDTEDPQHTIIFTSDKGVMRVHETYDGVKRAMLELNE